MGAAVWVVREDALAVAARGGSGRRRSAGACRRGVQGVVVMGIQVRGSESDRAVDSARVLTRRNGAAADQKTASERYTPQSTTWQVYRAPQSCVGRQSFPGSILVAEWSSTYEA